MNDKSDFMFEKYRLNELTSAERLQLEAEPDFQSRIRKLEESDAEILNTYNPADMSTAIRQKSDEIDSDERQKISVFPYSRITIPLAAAAVLILALFVALPSLGPGMGEGMSDTTRPKGIAPPETLGTPDMILYRNSPAGVETLENGDSATEHDLIQVAFTGGGSWWGSILSVDGNGIVTRHWPMEGDDAVPLGNTSEFLLPFSYELDDAPSFEAFFLIWSDSTFTVPKAMKLLEEYDGTERKPDVDSINPTGKNGVTVIKVLKSP